MTPSFAVQTVPQFDHLLRRLAQQHPELAGVLAEAFTIFRTDPYNRSHQHDILKLTGASPGEGGQYRLHRGCFWFRDDIERRKVIRFSWGLRREDTYR
jgi:hypothetical protein